MKYVGFQTLHAMKQRTSPKMLRQANPWRAQVLSDAPKEEGEAGRKKIPSSSLVVVADFLVDFPTRTNTRQPDFY